MSGIHQINDWHRGVFTIDILLVLGIYVVYTRNISRKKKGKKEEARKKEAWQSCILKDSNGFQMVHKNKCNAFHLEQICSADVDTRKEFLHKPSCLYYPDMFVYTYLMKNQLTVILLVSVFHLVTGLLNLQLGKNK